MATLCPHSVVVAFETSQITYVKVFMQDLWRNLKTERRVAPCRKCHKFAFCLQVNKQMHTYRVVFKCPTPLFGAANPEVQRVVTPGPQEDPVKWGAICLLVISSLFISLFPLLPTGTVVFNSTFVLYFPVCFPQKLQKRRIKHKLRFFWIETLAVILDGTEAW